LKCTVRQNTSMPSASNPSSPSVQHLLKHTDWSASPLGPSDGWPADIRMLVRQVLAAQFPMWVAWGPDLRMIYNDAYCAILGAKHPSAWTMPARTVWSEILEQIDPLFASTLGGAATPLFQTTFDIARGEKTEKVWFNFALTPVLAEDGQVLGIFCAITENTSLMVAQEIAELERQRAELMAAANAAERDRLWNLATEVMLVADYRSIIVAINPAWQAVLGWSVEESVGSEFLHLVHPDDRVATMAEVSNLERGITTLRFENRYRHLDRSYRHISWTAVPGNGAIHAVGRDVTSERELQAQLTQSTEALLQAQKMEAVGQLTGGLAHDFNNLLAGITGSLQVIRKHAAIGRYSEIERFLDIGMGSAHRAAALTHRLLAFSRRQNLQPKVLDVGKLVRGIEDLVRRTVGPAITLEVVSTVEAWNVMADESQLENAVLNLCINARDAMPDGGKLTIETANRWVDDRSAMEIGIAPGQYASLSVSDTGVGMARDVVERAFEPFFTTKPLGSGTGLGLSMIYGFAKQSGGHARICSELGAGTMVALYIPRTLEVSAGRSGGSIVAEIPAAQAGECVLVVDDEPSVRDVVMEVMKDLGYRAIQAANGPDALALLSSAERVDLLITDVGLPGGMNGRQLADAARVGRPSLKVLFITGYAENAVFSHGHLDNGMEMLSKPFDVDVLARRSKALIDSVS
jgi:PAS domain S-box-containing protein